MADIFRLWSPRIKMPVKPRNHCDNWQCPHTFSKCWEDSTISSERALNQVLEMTGAHCGPIQLALLGFIFLIWKMVCVCGLQDTSDDSLQADIIFLIASWSVAAKSCTALSPSASWVTCLKTPTKDLCSFPGRSCHLAKFINPTQNVDQLKKRLCSNFDYHLHISRSFINTYITTKSPSSHHVN